MSRMDGLERDNLGQTMTTRYVCCIVIRSLVVHCPAIDSKLYCVLKLILEILSAMCCEFWHLCLAIWTH